MTEPSSAQAMPASISCLHLNHINAVVESFDDSVAYLRDVYGAQLVRDMPRNEWHAGLITIGTVIIELFAPNEYLLNARLGPHYVGLEYQVPDVSEARQAVHAAEKRIIRDLGGAFHVHPADAFGVALEAWDGNFHQVPPPVPFLELINPIEYWRDEHPLGCTGLKRYSIAVADLDRAAEFFRNFVGAKVLYEEPRPAVGARAVGLEIADSVAELISPTSDGYIERYLARYGDGIRSCVFSVRDLEQARSYLAGRGLELQAGDAEDTFAVAPTDNQGLLFEFSE